MRNQLKITEEQFWQALDTGEPVDRTPPPAPPEQISTADRVREGLRREGVRDEQIDAMEPDEAQQELYRRWTGESSPAPRRRR